MRGSPPGSRCSRPGSPAPRSRETWFNQVCTFAGLRDQPGVPCNALHQEAAARIPHECSCARGSRFGVSSNGWPDGAASRLRLLLLARSQNAHLDLQLLQHTIPTEPSGGFLCARQAPLGLGMLDKVARPQLVRVECDLRRTTATVVILGGALRRRSNAQPRPSRLHFVANLTIALTPGAAKTIAYMYAGCTRPTLGDSGRGLDFG